MRMARLDATHRYLRQNADGLRLPVRMSCGRGASGATVNMGFGLRNRPPPLIPLLRLPRLLPAAALRAMETAPGLLKELIPGGEVHHRPDLLAGIDEIRELMGRPAVREMELHYNDLEAVALPE